MNEKMTGINRNSADVNQAPLDLTWRGIYRAGGLAMLITGLFVLVGATLGSILGTTPGDSTKYLQSLADHHRVAQATYWSWALYAIFLVPAILGLYQSLKGIDKNAMLIAAGLALFFIILDLAVTELDSLALVRLTRDYAAATSDVQRAAYLAAEHWGLAIIPYASFFSWIGPSLGLIIAATVMLKGIYSKFAAYLGIIVNALGIIGGFYFLHPVAALSVLLTPILFAYGVWFLVVGRRMFSLGK